MVKYNYIGDDNMNERKKFYLIMEEQFKLYLKLKAQNFKVDIIQRLEDLNKKFDTVVDEMFGEDHYVFSVEHTPGNNIFNRAKYKNYDYNFATRFVDLFYIVNNEIVKRIKKDEIDHVALLGNAMHNLPHCILEKDAKTKVQKIFDEDLLRFDSINKQNFFGQFKTLFYINTNDFKEINNLRSESRIEYFISNWKDKKDDQTIRTFYSKNKKYRASLRKVSESSIHIVYEKIEDDLYIGPYWHPCFSSNSFVDSEETAMKLIDEEFKLNHTEILVNKS